MPKRFSQKNPFQRRSIETCWICKERPANSQEHSFKASRLRDLQDPSGPLHVPIDGTIHLVRGPNSSTVKFGKTICSTCNNDRTQVFDAAYDYFISFLKKNYDYFRTRDEFLWEEIFSDSPYSQLDLERYYIKNIGCRIVDVGAEVPEDIRSFLFDYQQWPTFTLLLFRDYSIDDAFKFLAEFQGTTANDFMSPFAHSVPLNLAGDPYTAEEVLGAFGAVVQDGPVGVVFQWAHPNISELPPRSFGIQPNFFMRDKWMFEGLSDNLLRTWEDYTEPVQMLRESIKLLNDLAQVQQQLSDLELPPYKRIVLQQSLQEKAKRVRMLESEMVRLGPQLQRLTGHVPKPNETEL